MTMTSNDRIPGFISMTNSRNSRIPFFDGPLSLPTLGKLLSQMENENKSRNGNGGFVKLLSSFLSLCLFKSLMASLSFMVFFWKILLRITIPQSLLTWNMTIIYKFASILDEIVLLFLSFFESQESLVGQFKNYLKKKTSQKLTEGIKAVSKTWMGRKLLMLLDTVLNLVEFFLIQIADVTIVEKKLGKKKKKSVLFPNRPFSKSISGLFIQNSRILLRSIIKTRKYFRRHKDFVSLRQVSVFNFDICKVVYVLCPFTLIRSVFDRSVKAGEEPYDNGYASSASSNTDEDSFDETLDEIKDNNNNSGDGNGNRKNTSCTSTGSSSSSSTEFKSSLGTYRIFLWIPWREKGVSHEVGNQTPFSSSYDNNHNHNQRQPIKHTSSYKTFFMIQTEVECLIVLIILTYVILLYNLNY